jgi:hypothetical protein
MVGPGSAEHGVNDPAEQSEERRKETYICCGVARPAHCSWTVCVKAADGRRDEVASGAFERQAAGRRERSRSSGIVQSPSWLTGWAQEDPHLLPGDAAAVLVRPSRERLGQVEVDVGQLAMSEASRVHVSSACAQQPSELEGLTGDRRSVQAHVLHILQRSEIKVIGEAGKCRRLL